MNSSFAPLPSKADGFPAPVPDFIFHDFYHAWVACHVPKEQRRFLCELFGLLWPRQKQGFAYKKAYHEFIDMDFLRDYWNRGSEKSLRRGLTKYFHDVFWNINGDEIKTLCALGLHTKPSSFDELLVRYAALDPRHQHFGAAYFRLSQRLCMNPSNVIRPQEWDKLQLEEFEEVEQFVEKHYWPLRFFTDKGVTFTWLRSLEPQPREKLFNEYVQMSSSLERGASLQHLQAHLTCLLQDVFVGDVLS